MRCKRKAWLDIKGNKSYKTWSAQRAIHLITEFKNFEKYTQGELFNGIKACEKGYKGVIGLKIKSQINKDLDIEVNPSLLIKIYGQSIWGKYKYIPAVSKLGKRTTKEHLLELALCSVILEIFQKATIEYGLIISSKNNQLITEKIFLNKKLKNKAIKVFSELSNSLKYNIPAITENRKKCSICSWQEFCNKEAKYYGYLTDIDGIGSKTASLLNSIGIKNIEQLAISNETQLNEKLSNSPQRNLIDASRYINQSKSYISGIPIQISSEENKLSLSYKKGHGFFIFDIESNPDSNHDFLFGFLSVQDIDDPLNNNYEAILNLNDSEKDLFLAKIFEKINSKEDWPILHYGETEKIVIIKLAKKLNFSNNEIELIKNRFIDLHIIIREKWILPVKNYSLKTVANWNGFNWEQQNVNGSKALFWWIQYQNTQQKLFLEKIIKYNKDDCKATLFIANWLLKQNS